MSEPAPATGLQIRRTRELVILFALFVVPGLAAPAAVESVVGTLSQLIAVTARNIAFALLIIYILDIQQERGVLEAVPPQIEPRMDSNGIAYVRVTDRPGTVRVTSPLGTAALAVGVWAMLLAASIAAALLLPTAGADPTVDRYGVAALTAAHPWWIWAPVLVTAMTSVGVVEETLFRAYLVGRLHQIGRPSWQAVGLAALMFSLGHGYQGVPALVFAFLAGVLLGLLWLRRPSLPAFAVGHAAYNLTAIGATLWYV